MGGCVTRYRELTLTADSIDDELQPGSVKFFAFSVTSEWLQRKRDLVVRVHVSQGRLRGVYCARDKPFPNQRRKVWDTERYCSCPSRTCDHCYPDCLNEAGGVCTDCRLHDEKWDRLAHEAALGGLAAEHGLLSKMPDGSDLSTDVELGAGGADQGADDDDDEANNPAAASGRLLDPPFPHQTDFEFSLRLSPLCPDQGPHLAPGRFFLTLLAAEERVSRALRKQRRDDGEPQTHPTRVTVWIEERMPRGDPRAGNPLRVAEAAERARQRTTLLATRANFGRKADQALQAQQEAALIKEQLGIDETKEAEQRKRALKDAAAAAAAQELQQESKHDDS